MAQYADIIEIVAPSQATSGNRVDITVRVKNTYSGVISIMVGGAMEYAVSPWPGIDFPDNWANVDGGAICSFPGSFMMPDKRVTIHAYSYWYRSDGYWYFDDELTRVVEVAAAPQPSISEFRIVDYVKV
ncbi:hypothetical protein CY91_04600 [Dehalococcoides mccartyi]|uniref:hypothetical protein n=1 Tax=Dehalococcoides mccartyi TaxID=61435 RepID=UPI00071CD201|nr:hypothetical protein [Dehalococcoides mccartyi]KSV16588.1 hypothetical protein CY91_04600 [Dehalococcoides mccartyi]